MNKGDVVAFVCANQQIVRLGTLRREEKLLDYWLIDGFDGKRYLIRDEEVINENSVTAHSKKENVQETAERTQQPETRKLGQRVSRYPHRPRQKKV